VRGHRRVRYCLRDDSVTAGDAIFYLVSAWLGGLGFALVYALIRRLVGSWGS
jgi:hypothetical protein